MSAKKRKTQPTYTISHLRREGERKKPLLMLHPRQSDLGVLRCHCPKLSSAAASYARNNDCWRSSGLLPSPSVCLSLSIWSSGEMRYQYFLALFILQQTRGGLLEEKWPKICCPIQRLEQDQTVVLSFIIKYDAQLCQIQFLYLISFFTIQNINLCCTTTYSLCYRSSCSRHGCS